MKATIYCRATDKGIHTFYLRSEGCDYYLFRQNYRRGVDEYFKGGVILERAIDFGKSRQNEAIQRTMQKLPSYIKYIEKEYEVVIFDKRANQKSKTYKKNNALKARRYDDLVNDYYFDYVA